jgi:hypothetical protein
LIFQVKRLHFFHWHVLQILFLVVNYLIMKYILGLWYYFQTHLNKISIFNDPIRWVFVRKIHILLLAFFLLKQDKRTLQIIKKNVLNIISSGCLKLVLQPAKCSKSFWNTLPLINYTNSCKVFHRFDFIVFNKKKVFLRKT